MNSTDLKGKYFISFSQNKFLEPQMSNGTMVIPKHNTFSRYFNIKFNSTNNFVPVCRIGLNISSRITANNSIIFAITFIFYICLALIIPGYFNRQPFKSRFLGPYISFVGVYVNFINEFIFSIITYENTSPYCILVMLFSYAPLQSALSVPVTMLARYMILLRIHNNKRRLIKKLKSKRNFHESNSEILRNRWKILRKKLLKILSSPWITAGVPLIWGAIFITITFSIYASRNFQCSNGTFEYMRLVHFSMFGVCVAVVLFLLIFDFVLNFRFIVQCKWKKVFFDDDPYKFRFDMIGMFLMLFPTLIWAFAPLPKVIFSIITDIAVHMGLWTGGMQALFITVVQESIISYRKSNDSRDSSDLSVSYVMSPEIIDCFQKFCESEWSVENILFKLEVEKYQNLKSYSDRLILAEMIKNLYLIPGASELEINCPSKLLNEIGKKIKEGDHEDDLFLPIEKVVNINLNDTISRFQFSKMYLNLLKEFDKKHKRLGL
eukprot:gene2010-1517_t